MPANVEILRIATMGIGACPGNYVRNDGDERGRDPAAPTARRESDQTPASSMNASDQASACGAGERRRFEYASPSNSEPDGADAGVAASRFVPRTFEIRRIPW